VLLAGAFVWGAIRLPQGLLVFLYLVVAGFDGFAEASGRYFGRTKLAPTISPGKTVEGVFGGLIGAVAIAALVGGHLGFTLSLSVILCLATAFTALLGDLAASWVKRRAHIKDFSSVVPGHGGILDRFDSFIAVGAILGLLLSTASIRGVLG
jgi:phosphatidate cytidylyltransferase